MLPVSAARAVTITAAFPTAVTVPENGLIQVVAYAFTNVSGNNITINTISSQFLVDARGQPAVFAGDPTDTWMEPFSNDFGNCPRVLANLAQCTAHASFMVPDGTGETDANNGQFTITTSLAFTIGGVAMSTGDLVTIVTVTDPAVPGPVVGAGTPGLIAACVGLLAWWRRRRKAA
jgi:hypothetical protein